MKKKTSNDNIKQAFDELFQDQTEEERLEHEARMIMYRFLSKVEEEMEKQGLSRKDLAKMIGTSASYVTQLFRGDKMINLPTLAKIQDALDMKFEIRSDRDHFVPDKEGYWVYRTIAKEKEEEPFPSDLNLPEGKEEYAA